MTRRTPHSSDRPGPAPDPAGDHHERRIRSFQPRRGRVTTAQRGALERLWPLWGVEVDGRHRLDLAALFATTPAPDASPDSDRPAEGAAPEGARPPEGGAPSEETELPVVLEVGFGMGEATARMAAADPTTGILAVDVHTPGQGNLLRLAEAAGLANVRVANGDAIILLRTMLEPDSLAGMRVYFPDPWPKARHQKRRLIQPEFLDVAAGPLRSGALVHCATDWADYAEQMLDVLTAHPEYENTRADGGFAERPASRPLTRFEGQGLDKGHEVFDLLFRRR
ncbi:tRNA (guanosine(46)-N7)-methyltransferase TrmB [Streptomyces sp. AJS327]|uniref:tRNA (guanosine(46)-N7)-methyltransferase TrmB n=1 Tax=Streptomyces sp. AJS327 TaxID=2545265 RepID=UPI0027E3FAA0|nr:tRNA (guanosine(46)-N7)-methyltransferase TrmB [Streptomyces sp. AJS327]